MKQFKAYRAFENNRPDFWLVSEHPGFGSLALCRCETQEHAEQIAQALNIAIVAREILEALRPFANEPCRGVARIGLACVYADNLVATAPCAPCAARAVIAKVEGRS